MWAVRPSGTAPRCCATAHTSSKGTPCIADRLVRRSPRWRCEPLPLSLSPDILRNPIEARHFDGFASPTDLKGDAQTAFIRSIEALPNVDFRTGSPVIELSADATDITRIRGVRLADQSVLEGRIVILAAGALHSPRLLQRYLESNALTDQLACGANLGRKIKNALAHRDGGGIAINKDRFES